MSVPCLSSFIYVVLQGNHYTNQYELSLVVVIVVVLVVVVVVLPNLFIL